MGLTSTPAALLGLVNTPFGDLLDCSFWYKAFPKQSYDALCTELKGRQCSQRQPGNLTPIGQVFLLTG